MKIIRYLNSKINRACINRTFFPVNSLFILFCLISLQFISCFPIERPKENTRLFVRSPKNKVTSYKERKIINDAKGALSNWLQHNTVHSIVPSIATIVVQDDKVIYKGLVRSSPNKLYMVASLTKTFVAISVLQLAERGVISLNDPISKYLHVNFENPKLKSNRITIRQLLTHTSGLVEDESPNYDRGKIPFIVPHQRYPAGFRFNYCNQGYNLLGYLIFEVTGMSLGDYISRNILIPLEMFDSEAPPSTRGAVGIKCSINDMANYVKMLLAEGRFKGKRIISQRMFREILKESVSEPYSKYREYRGICWRIWTINDKIYSMHHAAHMNGGGGYMQLFPRHGIGYLFICNPPVYNRNEFYRYYYGIKHRLIKFSRLLMDDGFRPLQFRADKPSDKQLKKFAGRYKEVNNGKYVDVEYYRKGYLRIRKSYSSVNYIVYATSMHTFVYIYPGQTERGEIFDFVIKWNRVVGLGVRDGYFIK